MDSIAENPRAVSPPEAILEWMVKVFDYDPSTGIIIWKITVVRGKQGAKAGSVWSNKQGKSYRTVSAKGRNYPAHCVAYFLMTGDWPTGEIDHKDSDGVNNVWSNLRHSTKSQNQANARIRKDNSVGFKGVSMRWGRYIARIQVNKKRINIGWFDSAEKAHAAYLEKAIVHFGEFGRGA